MPRPASRNSAPNPLAAWSDIFKRAEVARGMEEIDGRADGTEVRRHILPGLGRIAGSALKLDRHKDRQKTSEIVSDDLVLMVSLNESTKLSASERQLVLGSGDAVLLSATSLGLLSCSPKSRFVSLALPGKVIRSLVSDIETALLLLIPGHSAPLRLLANYINAAVHKDIAVTPELRRIVAGHVHDLVALAIGMARDAAPGATRVDRSVRLRAIKADIVDKLNRRDLTVNLVAEHHRLSARYLQRLFKDEGTTFSEFVLDRRLDHAHHMLSDREMVGRTVSAVAFACGFGDLSYFNRCFRRRYGMSPSEARAALLRE